MSSIELVGVSDAVLRGAQASFGAGLHVVLGTERDGTHALASLVLGLTRPRQGSVRVAGFDPYRSPEIRRRIAAVLGVEAPPSDSSVESALRKALELRGDALDPVALLTQAGLSTIGGARPDRLPADVWRDVVLALALGVSSASVVVIVEPLASGLGRAKVREQVLALANAGACVLCLTASPLDAAELGGDLVLLDQGRFVRRPSAPLALELAPGGELVLRVRSNDARALAGRLASDPAVGMIDWNAEPGELRVSGTDPDALGLAILRAASEAKAEVSAIEPVLPALDEVRAATAALWRAAYEAAYRTGQAHARARAEAWRAAAQAQAQAQAQPQPQSQPPSPPSGGAT